ncbi:MAG: hypothetical protein ACK4ND_05205 [Cytophagaceae bacterium]
MKTQKLLLLLFLAIMMAGIAACQIPEDINFEMPASELPLPMMDYLQNFSNNT